MKVLRLLDALLVHCEEILSALAMLSMSLVVFASVLCRYALSIPFATGEEIARYLLVWCTFLGIIGATRKRAHVSIEVFVDLLPPLPKRLICLLSEVITFAAFSALFYLSLQLIGKSMGPRAQLTPLTRLPYWYMYSSLAVGFGFSALRCFQMIVKSVLPHAAGEKV